MDKKYITGLLTAAVTIIKATIESIRLANENKFK